MRSRQICMQVISAGVRPLCSHLRQPHTFFRFFENFSCHGAKSGFFFPCSHREKSRISSGPSSTPLYFTMKSNLLRFVFTALAVAVAPVGATVVSIAVSGPQGCDPLLIPSAPLADQLGFAFAFPAGERISFSSITTDLSACVQSDDKSIRNKLVSVTNLETFAFAELYYVAHGGPTPGTFSNFDGYVNGVMAMKIDKAGNNFSLWSESMTPDGIFEPGETWEFIVQDYVSSVPVDAFYNPGFVGSASGVPSIIVPEPTGAALSLLSGLLLLRRKR